MDNIFTKENIVNKKKCLKLFVNNNCNLKVLNINNFGVDYLGWLNDYEIVRYTDQRFVNHSLDDIKLFVEEKSNSKSDILFGIFFDDKHIGNIKLGSIKWEHNRAELSYFIGNKNYWGQGIASSVIKKVINFGFRELNLKKINAGYYSSNLGSAKVLNNCGFLIEGIRKKDIIYEDKRIDLILVGITKS